SANVIFQINKAKGFWDNERNIGELLMLVVSELGEAIEAHRKGFYGSTQIIDTYPDDYEEWRDIAGFEGVYQVSNLGDVRSLDMVVFNGVNYYSKEGRILSKGLGGNGYYTVSLKGKSYKVARLVAMAFCEGYFEGAVVNHINGNKLDDFANNLEWVTYSENNNHALKTGLRDMTKILSKDDILNIAFMAKNKVPHKIIHEKYPMVSLSRIKSISRMKERFTETFEFEIADAVIRLLDLSAGLGIDLEKHINEKVKYNKLRERLHGKQY